MAPLEQTSAELEAILSLMDAKKSFGTHKELPPPPSHPRTLQAPHGSSALYKSKSAADERKRTRPSVKKHAPRLRNGLPKDEGDDDDFI